MDNFSLPLLSPSIYLTSTLKKEYFQGSKAKVLCHKFFNATFCISVDIALFFGSY